MSYKRVNRRTEGEVRQAILTYFLTARSVDGMESDEPFVDLVQQKVFTWERIKMVRRSLVAAGLLEQMRGSTRDVVLRTTDLGRQAMMPE